MEGSVQKLADGGDGEGATGRADAPLPPTEHAQAQEEESQDDSHPPSPSYADVPCVVSEDKDTRLCVDEGATIVQDDLDLLLAMLPVKLRQQLREHPNRASLLEVVMDLGRRPEARFLGSQGGAIVLREDVVTREELEAAERAVGDFGGDNRAGIPLTLHRISAIRNRKGGIIGLTCRVGRAVTGHIDMIRDLLDERQSILFLGPPGVGKTTVIREMARVIADEMYSRVVIVDTSNEIGGDGDVPHPAIGGARRMQVAEPQMQHRVMIEAVQNHMPEIIIVDEVGTETECIACRSIAERGVMLIATAHGHTLENLLKNPSISDLIGGIESVTLGDDEARARGTRKTVLERKGPPTFPIVIEMRSRSVWVIHKTDNSVDNLLLEKVPMVMVRNRGGPTEDFEVKTRVVPYESETDSVGGAVGRLDNFESVYGYGGGYESDRLTGSGADAAVSPLDALSNPSLAAAVNSKGKGGGAAKGAKGPKAGGKGDGGPPSPPTKKEEKKVDPYSWVDSLESLQAMHLNGNGKSNSDADGYEIIAEVESEMPQLEEDEEIGELHFSDLVLLDEDFDDSLHKKRKEKKKKKGKQ